jgi:hypothetical protein
MRNLAITIRNFLRRSPLVVAGLIVGSVLASTVAVIAQPGVSPNFAWLRGAALGANPALVCQGLDTNVNCNIVTQGTGTLLLNGTPIPGVSGGAGTFASLSVTTGPNTIAGSTTFNGLILARPGASIVTDGLGGIVLANSSTNVTTTLAATEQDLFNFSIPANTLSADNQYLVLTFRDRNAATANTKQLRIRIGATLVMDSTAVAANNNWWPGDCIFWRTGAATQKAVCGAVNITNGGSFATAAGGGMSISTPAEDTTAAITLRITGTDAVAAGGSNLEGVNLVWYPAGQ